VYIITVSAQTRVLFIFRLVAFYSPWNFLEIPGKYTKHSRVQMLIIQTTKHALANNSLNWLTRLRRSY